MSCTTPCASPTDAEVTKDISASDRASLIKALDQMQARINPERT